MPQCGSVKLQCSGVGRSMGAVKNTSLVTKKLGLRREACFSLLAEMQVDRLFLPDPYSFFGSIAGKPFFVSQRMIFPPPQYFVFVFSQPPFT